MLFLFANVETFVPNFNYDSGVNIARMSEFTEPQQVNPVGTDNANLSNDSNPYLDNPTIAFFPFGSERLLSSWSNMTGFIFAVSPEEFWSISIYPLVSGSKEADSITPESIWLLKDNVDENLKFPFIKAEFLSDELTSINKELDLNSYSEETIIR